MQHCTLKMCKQHFCTPAFSMHFLLFSKHDIIFRAKIVLTGKTPYTHLDQTLRWNEANVWLFDLTQSMRQMLLVWGRMRKMLAAGKCHSHFTRVRFDLSKGMDNTYIFYNDYTLPETNRAPENRSSQKEFHLPSIYFEGLNLVSGRVFLDTWCMDRGHENLSDFQGKLLHS